MIDPVSAFAMASAAFNGIKKMVDAGKEFEDVLGQIGIWMGMTIAFMLGGGLTWALSHFR